jgi:prophage regulatory protein
MAPICPTIDRILGKNETCQRTNLSKATIYRLELRNEFPKRRRISSRRVGWLESEIVEWLRRKTQA